MSYCIPWIPPVWVSPRTARALDVAMSGSGGVERGALEALTHALPHGSSVGAFSRAEAGRAAGRLPKYLEQTAANPQNPADKIKEYKGQSWTLRGSKYVSGSSNSKTGAVDGTWVSVKVTCVDCELKRSGMCYVLAGQTKNVNDALDKAASKISATQVSLDEAAVIDGAYRGGAIPSGTVLRVHMGGDTSTVEGARAIAASIARWKARGGKTAYTYTHAWRRVPRAAFGPLSVLASLDPSDLPKRAPAAALAQGYGSFTLLVHPTLWAKNMRFDTTGSLSFQTFEHPDPAAAETGYTFLPCPAQRPVDTASYHDAAVWKRTYLAFFLGLITEKPKNRETLKRLVDRLLGPVRYERDPSFKVRVRGETGARDEPAILPVYSEKQEAMLRMYQERLVEFVRDPRLHKRSLEQPKYLSWAELFRAVRLKMRWVFDEERTTCEECTACFSDRALGERRQAVAFRPDKSSGGYARIDKNLSGAHAIAGVYSALPADLPSWQSAPATTRAKAKTGRATSRR